jgi:hypothetical protein
MNVAPAVNGTDAVNLTQVQAMVSAAAVASFPMPSRRRPAHSEPGSPSVNPVVFTNPPAAGPVPPGTKSRRGGSDHDNGLDTISVGAQDHERSNGTAAAAEELESSTIVGWANAKADGTLSGSRNIIGTARHSTGEYEISFKKSSLRRCTYNATLAGVGFISVKAGSQANSLRVETRNHYGVLSDASFQVMAVC